ncbi:MAG: alpha/beta hydrolase [Sphingomonadales bacterium]|nr:alpha/beta hydrolase [Sphingomonadales bacterium]
MTDRQFVYLHGIPGSAAELALVPGFPGPGVRLFAPDRMADAPQRDFATYCDDLAARVVTAFPAGPVRIAAFSLGARMAVETGLRLGQRVEAIDLIAPAAPLTCGVDLRDMAGGAVFRLARDAPRRFAALASVQAVLARRAPMLLARMLFAGAQGEDAVLARDAEFMHRIAAILRSGFGQGTAGYRREMRAYVEPWHDRIASLTAPVTLWHGEADNWAPVAMATWLAGAFPRVQAMHRLPGKSHYSALIAALPMLCTT